MNTLTDITLPQLLTPSIASDTHVVCVAEALSANLTDIAPAALEAQILSRIDSLSENMLDLLAWQFHADFYDLAYNIDVKRRHVKSSILWHLHKGTSYAILEALRLIDIQAQFVNWPDFGGEPYTFKISAVVAGDFYRTRGKDRLAFSIRRAVTEAKAERSLMVKLDIQINQKETAGLYGAAARHQTIDISLGVNQSQMHELLLIFEQRILSKLTNCFNTISNKLEAHEERINQKLAENEAASIERLKNYESQMQEFIRITDQCQWQRISDNNAELNKRLTAFAAEFRAGISELKELLTWTE